MKKTLVIIAVTLSIISCNKSTQSKENKTAYVDTSKLLEQYTEAKDIEAKYKAKSDEMGKELEAEVSKFKLEAASFQKNAQANGQAWAQENGARLQKKEQELNYAQQAMIQQLQQESGVEMDTLVKGVKKFIKTYGKEKGYAYIYGTGEAASILYAEDKYDITSEIVKLLNEKYKSADKKENNTDIKAEAKKEIEALKNKK
jgi:outer membrane protein